jgi:hypothetical protein
MANKVSRPINRVVTGAQPKKKLDFDKLLTPEKMKEIRLQAEAKIHAREVADAEEQYLQQQMDEYERKLHPEIVQEMRDITLDLPPYMDRIILDGRVFMQSGRYTVTKNVFDVMREITWAAFRHDDEVNNRRNSNAYRQERQLRMSAQDGSIVDSTGRPTVKF